MIKKTDFKLPLYALALGSFISCQAAPSKVLRVKIEGVKEKDTALLAGYLGDKLFVKDTAFADKKGVFQFKKAPELLTGAYSFVLKQNGKQLMMDLIWNGEPMVDIQSKLDELTQNAAVVKSEENKFFYDYVHFIDQNKKEVEKLATLRDSSKNEEEKAKYSEQIAGIDKSVKEKQKIFAGNDLYAARMLAMSVDLEVPKAPANETDTQTWAFNYYKQHYLDIVDFKDPNMGNNALFHNRVMSYLDRLVFPDADSAIVAVDMLLKRATEGTETYKYLLHTLASKYEDYRLVCMDKVFVHLLKNYFIAGKAFWLKKDQIDKLKDRVESMQNLVCGNPAPDLTLLGTDEKTWYRLSDIKADYTVLAFWAHDCSHCQRDMPKLAEMMQKYPKQKVEVYSVEVNLETKEWKEFLDKNPLTKRFINVSDTPEAHNNPYTYIDSGKTTLESLNFRKTYDIYSTPAIYLLDKNKRIMYKNLSLDSLQKLLEEFVKK